MDQAQPLNILGIPGSLRKDSYNKAALKAALTFCPREATIEIFELDDIPPFNGDHEHDPPARVVELKSKVRSAGAILFATPEYNYSFSGVLKNAIDWGSRPYGDNSWAGKPAAIMGASTGLFGTARAQYHLRQVLQGVNMLALTRPEVMITQAPSKFDAQGNLVDEKTMALVTKLLQGLIEWTLKLKKPQP
jgi:chromate reductase, NAD(P)H dehydrogenase (quinone)